MWNKNLPKGSYPDALYFFSPPARHDAARGHVSFIYQGGAA
jgi:hypothetical protein